MAEPRDLGTALLTSDYWGVNPEDPSAALGVNEGLSQPPLTHKELKFATRSLRNGLEQRRYGAYACTAYSSPEFDPTISEAEDGTVVSVFEEYLLVMHTLQSKPFITLTTTPAREGKDGSIHFPEANAKYGQLRHWGVLMSRDESTRLLAVGLDDAPADLSGERMSASDRVRFRKRALFLPIKINQTATTPERYESSGPSYHAVRRIRAIDIVKTSDGSPSQPASPLDRFREIVHSLGDNIMPRPV